MHPRHKGCDELISWLDWVFEGDRNKIMLMMCFLNAIVTQRSDLQKFMQIIGQGGTGKSTFSIVARALVGIENCRSTQMSALEGNRFEGANLYGKRLLIISEADSYTGDAPMIKNITGGDPIRYEVKGIQSRLDFVFNGKLLIVANKPFEPKEAGSAWYRRVINVPFNREVSLDKKESLLEIQGDRFVGKFEPYIAGLLDKVLSISDETVRAFLDKTSRYVPSLDEHKAEIILHSNPLAQWCDENLVLLPTAKTYIGNGERLNISTEAQGGDRVSHTEYKDSDKLLYSNYCQFCTNRGNALVSLQRFSRSLLELFNGVLKVDTVKKSRDTHGTFITDLVIRTPDHVNIPTPIKKTLLNNVELMTGNVNLMKAENIASESSVDYVGFFQNSVSSEKKNEETVMPNTGSNRIDRHEITNNTQVLKEVAKMPTRSTYPALATVSSYTESTYSDSKPTYVDAPDTKTSIVEEGLESVPVRVGDRVRIKVKTYSDPWTQKSSLNVESIQGDRAVLTHPDFAIKKDFLIGAIELVP